MNDRTQASLLLIAVLAMVFVGSPTVAAASSAKTPPPPTYQPPVYSQAQISLVDAVKIALEHDPTVRLQAESANVQKGIEQVATGQFDTSLIGSLTYDFSQTQLNGQTVSSEQKKRDSIQKQADQYGNQVTGDDAILQQITNALNVVQNGANPNTVNFPDPVDQAQFQLYLALLQTAPPAQQPTIQQGLINYLNGFKTDTQKDRDTTYGLQQQQLQMLRELGPVPQIGRNYDADLNFQLQTQYRNGITFTPFFDLAMNGTGYQGKPKSATFGGTGVLDNYTSSVGFTIDLPLGRNRGVEATGAIEKSAHINYEASLSTLVHTAATSVFNASAAYWNLVGAQENVKTLEQNLALQQKLVELTKTLIDADEIPRSELARAQAAEANARAQLDDAKRSEHEARVTLAQTIGLEVDQEANAPPASDAFPQVPDEASLGHLSVQTLGDEALAQRYDLKAALQLQQSGGVLLRAAVLNLRRQADLSLKLFYGGENDTSVVGAGIRGALLGRWTGPSASFSFSLNYPFANNVQQGLLTQQTGQYNQQVITARDLERTIRANVVLAVGSLQEAARQVRQYTEAVGYYKQSIDAEVEKLKLGSSTLIDTITTQQRLTDAMQALVASQQQYAELLTRLRYETGTLVAQQTGGKLMTLENLTGLPPAQGTAK